MSSTRRSFTPEYKQDAVALIVDGGHTIGEIVKKLEISETSIRKWVKEIQPPTGPVPDKPLTESERTELARLRKENGVGVVCPLTRQQDARAGAPSLGLLPA